MVRVPNWKEVGRSQVALGLVLLTQALLIFLARPQDASLIYEKAGTYLFAIGPFDAANDNNFDHLSQINRSTASQIVNHRIFVTNLTLIFSAANLIFYPFYRAFLVGAYLPKKHDYRAHILFFASILLMGFALFWHVNLDGDYFSIGSVPPNSSDASPDGNWWFAYGVSQTFIIFWSGLLISILVPVIKSLVSSLGIR